MVDRLLQLEVVAVSFVVSVTRFGGGSGIIMNHES